MARSAWVIARFTSPRTISASALRMNSDQALTADSGSPSSKRVARASQPWATEPSIARSARSARRIAMPAALALDSALRYPR